MLKRILGWFGYTIKYRDHRGLFDTRYDMIDFHMMRPMHEGMSTAYPSAKAVIVKEMQRGQE